MHDGLELLQQLDVLFPHNSVEGVVENGQFFADLDFDRQTFGGATLGGKKGNRWVLPGKSSVKFS